MNVIMPNVNLLNFNVPSVIVLNANIPSVIMLNVIMPSVVAPLHRVPFRIAPKTIRVIHFENDLFWLNRLRKKMTLSRCPDFASTCRFVERRKIYLLLEDNLDNSKYGKGS